jgi:hypothetical protein
VALPESSIAVAVRSLEADIAATLGAGSVSLEPFVENGRSFHDDPAEFARWLVEDVQQYFHDAFVDTTWPACPRHPNHPLWFRDGWWCCGDDRLARLGELSLLPRTSRRSSTP